MRAYGVLDAGGRVTSLRGTTLTWSREGFLRQTQAPLVLADTGGPESGHTLDRGAICATLLGRRLLMSIDFGTALVVCALIASLTLTLSGGDRFIPAIALVVCAIEALIAFRVIQLSSSKFRIDVILPAVLVVTGGICWSRSSTKSAITGSTAITLVGLIQLLLAIHVFR